MANMTERDTIARVFDAKSGALKREFKGHEKAVYAIQVNITYFIYIDVCFLYSLIRSSVIFAIFHEFLLFVT
jgi:hypothetical protein